MPNTERVELVGHLGADPRRIERRETGEFLGVELTVPVSHRKKNRETQEWETLSTNWWKILVWGDAAKPLLELKSAEVEIYRTVNQLVHHVRARMYEGKDGAMKSQLEAVAWNGGISRVSWQRRAPQGGTRESPDDSLDIPAEEEANVPF